jgi:hypothetical protein
MKPSTGFAFAVGTVIAAYLDIGSASFAAGCVWMATVNWIICAYTAYNRNDAP